MLLKSLTAAERADGNLPLGGTNACVRVEPMPGAVVHVSLGPGGIVVRWGKESVGVPMDELMALVGLDKAHVEKASEKAVAREEERLNQEKLAAALAQAGALPT